MKIKMAKSSKIDEEVILHNESSSRTPKYFGARILFFHPELILSKELCAAGQRFSGYSRMMVDEVTGYVLYLRLFKLYHR